MNFNKKILVVRGPVMTQSGYGTHSRQVAEWALDQEGPNLEVIFQPLPWGINPWLIDENKQNGLIKKIIDRSKPLQRKPDYSIQVQLPNEWDEKLANFNVGVSAVVESSHCSNEWVQKMNLMNMVIVPSTHTEKVIKNSGEIKVPLFVIPESFPSEFLSDPPENNLFDFSTDFNFLLFGQVTGTNPENDRKNIFYTIKWFCEVFKDNPDVGLIVKTNSGRSTKIDKIKTRKLLQSLLREVRKSEFPKVHFIHGNLDEKDLHSLYTHNKVKALLTLTRGEGFGLPILESAVCGLPVIATNWSGHLDFLNIGKFIKVDYDLSQIPKSRVDGKIFIENSYWANPSEEDSKRKMRKLYEKYEVPKQWALELSEGLKERYNIDHIKKMYSEVIDLEK